MILHMEVLNCPCFFPTGFVQAFIVIGVDRRKDASGLDNYGLSGLLMVTGLVKRNDKILGYVLPALMDINDSSDSCGQSFTLLIHVRLNKVFNR